MDQDLNDLVQGQKRQNTKPRGMVGFYKYVFILIYIYIVFGLREEMYEHRLFVVLLRIGHKGDEFVRFKNLKEDNGKWKRTHLVVGRVRGLRLQR